MEESQVRAAPVEDRPRPAGVLVVDDDGLIRSMLGTGLRQQGVRVWLAANGREAVEVYGRHAGEIDLVLLDVRMPGLDGPQTLAALEKIDPRVRCCFMSGDTGTYTSRELLRPTVLRVFRKPFRLDDVAEVLAGLRAKPPGQPA